jgi:hypothetical protein
MFQGLGYAFFGSSGHGLVGGAFLLCLALWTRRVWRQRTWCFVEGGGLWLVFA